jgi:hypothetical protein
MQEPERERQPMKPAKMPFDPNKLTPPQRKAYEIAKAQGVKPIHSLKELALDIEAELLDGLTEFVLESRAAERKHPSKDPFK